MEYQLPAPQELGNIYKMNPGAFGEAMELMDLGKQFAGQSLETNRLANELSAQKNPIAVQQGQADLQKSLYENKKAGRTDQLEEELFPQLREQEIKKYLVNAGTDDLKLTSQAAQKLLQSEDPSDRKRGESLMKYLPEVWKEKYKQDVAGGWDMAKIKEQGRNQLATANIYAKNKGQDANALPIDDPFINLIHSKYKRSIDKYDAFGTEIARLKSINPNDPKISVYTQMQNALIPSVNEERSRARNPGDIVRHPETGKLVPRSVLQVQPSIDVGPSQIPPRKEAPGKPVPSQKDLEFTAKKYGITVEEVKKKLGIN